MIAMRPLASFLDEHQQREQLSAQDRPVARLHPLPHRLFEASDNVIGRAGYSATGETRVTTPWRAGWHGNETQVPGNRARLLRASRRLTRRPRLQVPSTPLK